jgi:hypothetical protein
VALTSLRIQEKCPSPFAQAFCVQAFCPRSRWQRTSGTYLRAIKEDLFTILSLFSRDELYQPALLRDILETSTVYTLAIQYILLSNAACRIAEDCFHATFGTSGIFQSFGVPYFASDGGAQITISEVTAGAPVPELSSWALLAVGFAGLAFVRKHRMPGQPRLRASRRPPT